jgi:hypothetical protein
MKKENKKHSEETNALIKVGEELDKKEIDYEEDEPEFICKICGKKFETADRLDDHLGEHY